MRGLLLFLFGVICGAAGMYVVMQQGSPVRSEALPAVVAPPVHPSPAVEPIVKDIPAAPSTAIPNPAGDASIPSSPAAASDTTRVVAQSPDATQPLLIPVAGVPADQLSDTFDNARAAGRRHDAIDIMAPRGTRVLAAGDGSVVKLFTSARGGLTVYEFNPDATVEYYYAHLDSYAPGLSEGAKLHRGDAIGFVGSTGDANPDAPHLHFEIAVLGQEKHWWQATDINPYPVLSGKQTLATAVRSANTSSPAR